jgi:thiol-disulfide isomerase/thioredoxin
MKSLTPVALAGFAVLCVFSLAAQEPPPDPELQEQYELAQAVNDAGTSSVDQIRALEAHLKKFPATKQRAAIEQNLSKASIDANDDARIILYGEKLLQTAAAAKIKDDLTLLDRVIRALLESSDRANDHEQARKALGYAKRYEADVAAMRAQNPPGHLTPGQWSDEVDRALARALALEARATGDGDELESAAKIARKSWDTWPTGEGAREVAFWEKKLEHDKDAIEFYANAFTLEDTRTTETDRTQDRKRLGELYSRLNGSEKGLGEVILEAYDRTSALLNDRRASLKARDPNAVAVNPADFVLPPVVGAVAPLAISSLRGKTVVMDFWATWCAPCRAQQPIIEEVKKRFEASQDVIFVAVDADDDLSLVAPFIKEQGWKNAGYFEAGLAQKMSITSIPTVVVFDPAGGIYSRINGFAPDRFEQTLIQRIEEARSNR